MPIGCEVEVALVGWTGFPLPMKIMFPAASFNTAVWFPINETVNPTALAAAVILACIAFLSAVDSLDISPFTARNFGAAALILATTMSNCDALTSCWFKYTRVLAI